ncbi:MAG TPA: SufS family cysteine desulfurase [Bacilli bacterium]|nr:MAG: putative cysteine desulfurase [Tenericutes bacterium ADurb.BinA124]HPX84012.1 SufS family cysteine desulfurase [Bacilli bacterium]HQC74112.1 SufS family cysteine desulfurase [Bacilli bacterium]
MKIDAHIRDLFPIYQQQPHLVYLDSAATSLKPQPVLAKMQEYYEQYGVNIHRGVYHLSYLATEEYEKARRTVAKFINASEEEIVFTKNATAGLNMVALTYGETNLQRGDKVIVSELEHHSSLLPWMKLCERKQAQLVYVPLNNDGQITVENFLSVFDNQVKVVALTYVSNVMGYITPLPEIIRFAHAKQAVVVVDAAQAVPHLAVDVKALDADFLAFSAHKMLGPTGIGVLYGKAKLLKKLAPLAYGGDMNESVSHHMVEVKPIPYRFEAGTPAIAEALGLAKACEVITDIAYDRIREHDRALHAYALSQLNKISGLTVYNPKADIGIITFNINGVHPHDAATFFDQKQIALRAGHHCAQLVSKWLHCEGTLRASFYLYNTKKDVDLFVETVKQTVAFFENILGKQHE